MTSITFYTNPRSRGRIVRWMLEEVGAEYEPVYLEYGTSMGDADYRAVNPMGKVPAIRHDGNVVTETAAICTYLGDCFPAAGLAPPPDQRAAYYRWLFFGAGPLEAAITNQALGVEPSDEQQAFVGYGHMNRVLDTLETAIRGGAWIAADFFTAADLYVGSQIGFGLRFGTLEKRPGFEDYVARVTDRDAYRRAGKLDDEALEPIEGEGNDS